MYLFEKIPHARWTHNRQEFHLLTVPSQVFIPLFIAFLTCLLNVYYVASTDMDIVDEAVV